MKYLVVATSVRGKLTFHPCDGEVTARHEYNHLVASRRYQKVEFIETKSLQMWTASYLGGQFPGTYR